MGHSRNQVLAVIDLSHQKFGDEASVTYDGEAYALEKAAGLVPMKLALQQTQGGIAEGRYEMLSDAGTESIDCAGEPVFRTRHRMTGERTAELTWSVERKGDDVVLRQCSELRTLRYDFLASGDALALRSASVIDWQGNTPFRVTFAPALPDARRKFDGTVTSRFVMDVGGQRNHATGSVTSSWKDGRFEASWTSTEPWWMAERCARTTIEGTVLETDVWPCKDE